MSDSTPGTGAINRAPRPAPVAPAARPVRVLALETGGDVCGLALVEDSALVVEHTFRHRMRLSERLIGLTDSVLAEAGLTLRDVDAFAVGIGPGSFTGTRIGVMTAKVWARVLNRPLYGVNSLEALAAEYTGLRGVFVVPVLHCRPGSVYAAAYDARDGLPVLLAAPVTLPVGELPALFPLETPSAILFCGDAASRYREELTALFPRSAVSFGAKLASRAGAVAELARLRIERGEAGDGPLELVPLYLAPPPISVSKQPIPQPVGAQVEK